MTDNVSGEFGYKCFFFKQREWECTAKSMLAAKEKALEHFKPARKYRHMVSVVLCERPDGSTVTHSTGSL